MIKRIAAYLLTGIIALSGMTVSYADNEEFYTESVIYEESFDNEQEMTFKNEMTAVGKIAKLHPGNGDVRIINGASVNGTGNVLSINGGFVQLLVSGNPKLPGKSVISFDRYRDTQNANVGLSLYFSDCNTDDKALGISWRAAGYIDGAFPRTDNEYKSGNWYHFDVVIDEVMKAAYLYIDNKYIGYKDISAQFSDKNGYRFARFIFNAWSGKDVNYVDNIKIYEMKPNETDAEQLENLTALIANGTAEKNDLEQGVKLLAEKPDSLLRNISLRQISNYAEEKGWNDITETKCRSTRPENGEKVYIEDFDDISITFNYKLTDKGTVDITDNSGNIISCESACDGNVITVKPDKSELKPNTEYTVTVKGAKNFMGSDVSDIDFKFNTGFTPALNIKNNSFYSEGMGIEWEDYDGISTIVKLAYEQENAEEYLKGTPIDKIGKYTLTLTSEDGNKNIDSRVFTFSITEAYAPVAENPRIEAKTFVETDAELIGVFDYKDDNNDPIDEAGTEYTWYRADTPDGEGEVIGNEKTYTLTDDDESKYIRFEVIPKAVSIKKQYGEKVSSSAILAQCAPETTIPEIKVETVDSKTVLTAYFTYSDKNEDDEIGECIYTWNLKSPDGKQTTDSNTTSTITLDENYYDKEISVTVTPVSKRKPYKGESKQSEWYITPSRPVADNVKITPVTVGSKKYLKGEYTYHDANNDEEGSTSFKWVNASNGSVLSKESTLDITDLSGITVYFEVTPESVNVPKVGDGVKSAEYKIGSSKGSGSGSSSGGSGKSSFGYPTSANGTADKKSEDNTGTKMEFTDVKDHWAKEYIVKLYDKGLINGVSEEEFCPDRSITRAEFITMVLKVSGSAPVEYAGGFSDVSLTDWFGGYIQTALNEQLISDAESFRPNDKITREEAAKILTVMAENHNVNKDSGKAAVFTDEESISDWAKEYVTNAALMGIFKGNENGEFKPKDNMTRAEAAVTLYRIIEEE